MEDSWNRPDMPDKETKNADYGVPEPPVYEYDYGVPKAPGAGYGAQETQNAETSADSGTQGAQEYVSAETPEYGTGMPEAEMPGAEAKTAEPETPKNTPPRQDYYADGTPVDRKSVV